MLLFEKEYNSESLFEVTKDIFELFNEEYNDDLKSIPTDEYGFAAGTFKLVVTYEEPHPTNDTEKMYWHHNFFDV